MTLDTSGVLLEGTRYSVGNNTYTFPPNNAVQSALSVTERSEYVVLAESLDSSKGQLEIADPDLIFYWTRNEPGVTRFDYDSFSNRWLPLPGSPPRVVGSLSNDERLTIPVPDSARVASSPYVLYIDGSPRYVFLLSFIGSNPFSDPSVLGSGVVEVNSSGQLNFSAADAIIHKDAPVLFTGQIFFPRLQSKGNIGVLPEISTADYRLFMNPLPAAEQIPRIRIGHGGYLTPEAVALESLLTPPTTQGVFRWSVDTGRVMFCVADVAASLSKTVYYDGVFLGSIQLQRQALTVTVGWPYVSFNLLAAVGVVDPARFVVFAEKSGQPRTYFTAQGLLTVASTSAPTPGRFYVNVATGDFYLSGADVSTYAGWNWHCIDAFVPASPSGVYLQFYRSGVNGPGPAAKPDFVVTYGADQVLTDSISPASFSMLPTVPVDNANLQISVEMNTGTFVGNLVDSSDLTKPGFGHFIDFDAKQLKFTDRPSPITYVLPKAMSEIKLDGMALIDSGIQVKKNGTLLSPSEYDLNVSAGLLEFVEPVGEGDEATFSVSGYASGDTFTADRPLAGDATNKKLFVASGANVGLYDITSSFGVTLKVNPSFASSEQTAASVRATDEIIADRFWTPLNHVPRKFSIQRSSTGPTGTFSTMAFIEYALKVHVGQVSFVRAASPGESFRIDYISVDTADDGVTTTYTNRTEMARFKIRQEAATFAVGSKIVTFNPAGKTVNLISSPVVYVEGVTQDAENAVFTAPGTITLKDAVSAGPVTVDYWIEEAAGGETTVDLQHSPIDVDLLTVTGPAPGAGGGQTYLDINGDQTGTVKALGAFLVDDRDILYIDSVIYDPATGVTRATFTQPAAADGVTIKVTDVVNVTRLHSGTFVLSLSAIPPYMAMETNPVEIFVSGTNAVRIHGDVSVSYPKGAIIDFDSDPYWVLGSQYDSATDLTTVSTVAQARRNYITPVVRRSIRPVLDPAAQFATSRPAHTTRGFSLVKMGTNRALLRPSVDYDLGDGGVMTLKSPIVFGDVLLVMYVARVPQPIDTSFEFNFAQQIAPDDSNGILGQQLRMKYDLYAPDSFFYRIETVVSMFPEAKEAATGSASGPSGPNTADQSTTQQAKDAGSPSPWYDAKHYGNLDVVVQRLLKFYNDLVNGYEGLFADIDGRIVGGDDGKFRYDGNLNNPPAVSKAASTNNIDDRVYLYTVNIPFGFFPIITYTKQDIYGYMFQSNSMSRLFSTTKTVPAGIGDVSSVENGDAIGSFNVANIQSVSTTTTSRANAYTVKSTPVTGGTEFVVDASTTATDLTEVLTGGTSIVGKNGDQDSLTSAFVTGQKMTVYDFVGNLIGDGNVVNVTGTSGEIVTVDVVTDIQVGSLAQKSDLVDDPPGFVGLNMYIPGTDYNFRADSGQILYFKVPLPLSLIIKTNPMKGNEIVEANIVAPNPNLAPDRIPALDGLELNDSGRPMNPRRRNVCELLYYLEELANLKIGFATCLATNTLSNLAMASGSLNVGDSIKFLNGPNLGFSTTIASLAPSSATVNPPLPLIDPVGSDFTVGSFAIVNLINNEVNMLDAELALLDSITVSFGTQVMSGSGSASASTTWNDPANDLTGTDGKLLYVTSGPNTGLYKIYAASSHSVTIKPSPYPGLSAPGLGTYVIIDPWTFLKDAEYEFVAQFFRDTQSFRNSTAAWASNITANGVVARLGSVANRRAFLKTVIGDSGMLTILLRNGDNLYDMRYLWIDQRTNRDTGLKTRQFRALQQQVLDLATLTADQQKALVMDSLM
jgi:hypothetical protein